MHTPRRVAATLAAVAALSAAAPAVAGAQSTAAPPPASQLCFPALSMLDLGPLGPLGPYGPMGPWGPHGPFHGQPNPLGNAATCGGLWVLIARGVVGALPQGGLAQH
jgi:hypothetical protein